MPKSDKSSKSDMKKRRDRKKEKKGIKKDKKEKNKKKTSTKAATLEKFKQLRKDPHKNFTELEKMRTKACQKLRAQLLKLVSSDNYKIVKSTREKWLDQGDFAVRVYREEGTHEHPLDMDKLERTRPDEVCYYELCMVHNRPGTRRVNAKDNYGDAHFMELFKDGPEDEGNYEDCDK
jgi:hypothetical protein